MKQPVLYVPIGKQNHNQVWVWEVKLLLKAKIYNVLLYSTTG